MRLGVTGLAFALAIVAGSAEAQSDARLREARDFCWREQGYPGQQSNVRGHAGLSDLITACVRQRMAAGARGGPAQARR